MQAKANQMSPAAVEILDEASGLLASTSAGPVDAARGPIQAWAERLVPSLVDYCTVDLRVGPRRVVRLATAHRDRERQAIAEEIAARRPVDLGARQARARCCEADSRSFTPTSRRPPPRGGMPGSVRRSNACRWPR